MYHKSNKSRWFIGRKYLHIPRTNKSTFFDGSDAMPHWFHTFDPFSIHQEMNIADLFSHTCGWELKKVFTHWLPIVTFYVYFHPARLLWRRNSWFKVKNSRTDSMLFFSPLLFMFSNSFFYKHYICSVIYFIVDKSGCMCVIHTFCFTNSFFWTLCSRPFSPLPRIYKTYELWRVHMVLNAFHCICSSSIKK